MFHLLSIALFSASLVPTPQGVEVTTSGGSATVKNEADLKEIGLPVYPGARHGKTRRTAPRPRSASGSPTRASASWSRSTRPSDSPEMILAYYRKALGKFGPVLQCPGGSTTPSGLTCKDHEAKGGDVDLMAGSPEKRRIVGVEPASNGRTRFELVYLRTKGVEAH